MARSSAQFLRTPRWVRQMGRDGTNSGDYDISVRYPQANSPFLIRGIVMSPSSGHSGSLQVLNKWQPNDSDEIRDTPKLNTSVNRNLANDGNYASIFSKVMGRELSHSSSTNLYSRCWVDFMSNYVGTEGPNFMDLGILDVNASYEFNTFGTPATRIIRPTYVPHCSAPDHVFGEGIAVGMSATRSELDYR